MASLLVVSFALRALVPQGFMPSADNPFVLQICPDGFPAHLLQSASADPHAAHHEHGAHAMHGEDSTGTAQAPVAPTHQHQSASGEHCLFGAGAAGVGPLSQGSITPDFIHSDLSVVPVATAPGIAPPRYRIQQPRAPPQLS